MTVCYTRVRCDTTGCRGDAVHFCRYPVTRHGRQTTCNRRMCSRCADTDRHCPPHARSGKAQLVQICATCFSSSCAHGEIACHSPGKTRMVTTAQWKTLLSFGLL